MSEATIVQTDHGFIGVDDWNDTRLFLLIHNTGKPAASVTLTRGQVIALIEALQAEAAKLGGE